jgi:hypothetical protein
VPQGFELGERVLIPAFSVPSEPKPGDPATRPLWIYASDPASFGLRQPVLKVEVPYEEVKPGPEGALFKVSQGALPPELIKLLDWSGKAKQFTTDPLDLESRLMLVQGGMMPTTGDPRFAGQMMYAVGQQVWHTFARALGRNPTWGPWLLRRRDAGQSTQLLLKPYSVHEANAYYDRDEGSIGFGYFQAYPTSSEYVLPEGMVFVALSRDVIAHEMTHALLDGMRAEFMRDTHPDVRAFHEAFADIVALLHNFTQQGLVEQVLEDNAELNADALLGIGRQVGAATNGSEGGALRRALASDERRNEPVPDGRKYVEDDPRQDEHERGSVLVAAVFEAFLDAYEARARRLFRIARGGGVGKGGLMPTALAQLLAKEVGRLADQFLNICIRAIDYCPPVDIRFGEYLRAMLTADFDVVPDDGHGYRDKLIKSFRRRNIKIDHVLDLSQDSLRWWSPDAAQTPIKGLRFRDLRFEDDSLRHAGEAEIRRRAVVLGEHIMRDPAGLRPYGLHKPGGEYGPIVVQSIRLLYRVDSGGFGRNDLIAEVTQARTKDGSEFVGGATLIVGADGRLRYTVRKRVDDVKRRKHELEYAGPGGAQPLDLRALHRLPPRPPPRG